MANSVSVEISARDQNVSAVLKGVNDALGESAEGMETSFKGMKSHSDGLFGSLKDLRSETRSHERVFKFYGNQLSEVAGIAKGLGTEIAGLGIALGSGMWIAAAVSAVHIIIDAFKDIGKEAREAAKQSQEFIDKVGDALQREKERLAKSEGRDPEQDKLQGQIAAIDKLIAKREALAAAAEKEKQTPFQYGAQRELEEFDKQLEKAGRGVETLRRLRAQLVETSATKGQADKNEEDTREREKREAEEERERKKAEAEAERVRKQEAAAAAAAGEKARAGFEKDLAESAAIRLKWEMKEADDEEKVRLQVSEDLKKIDLLDEDTRQKVVEAGEREIARIRMKAASDEVTVAAKAWREQKAEQDKALHEMEASVKHYLQPLEHAITGAFTGLLDGQLDLAKAWDELWKGMLKTVVSTLVQMAAQWAATKIAEAIIGKATATSEAQGNIAVAATGAAASQAAIPVVGPVLATGAASSMVGFLEGLAGPLLASYDVGTPYVPYDQVAMIHRGERIVTAKDNEAGVGAGGHTFNFTIHALDGRSVYRTLKDSESDVMRFLREATAGGR